jgi:hypothetical protein
MLKLTLAGFNGIKIDNFMNNFTMDLQLQTNNFIISSNVVDANATVLTFFDSIDSG